MDLLAQHGENFKRIAVAMPNKASAACVARFASANCRSKTSVQVAEYFKSNYTELDLGSILAKAFPTAAGDVSIDTTLSSAPSPSASTVALQDTVANTADGSAEPTPPQNEENDARTIVLDPNEMWDSMDPGSRARSPTTGETPERASPAPEANSSISTSVSRSAPPMASLTRQSSVVEVGPGSMLR